MNNNLIPNNERSPEELREMGRKGGLASGRSRRQKRELKKLAKVIFDMSAIQTIEGLFYMDES